MATKTYIADYDNEYWIDSNNGRVFVPPPLVYGTVPTWSITLKSGGTAVDLSSAATWKAAVDYDFQHTSIAGALTAAKTGAVTAILVDGVATTPPTSGILTLTNGSAETEDVNYTSWTLLAGVYTFVVDKTLTYSYLENDVVSIENTTPMVRVLDADIDDTDADTGILLVTLDTRTQPFSDAIGSAKSLPAYIEILGLDGSNIPIHSILLDITARNAVDPVGGTPPTVVPGNYSTTGGAVTPDPTAESKEYYFDIDREKWTDSNGGVTSDPIIQYGTASQWKIHVISLAAGTVAHVDLTACTAFQISAHNAFKAASPSIRTVNDSIDSSAKANGIIYAILDARNTVFSGVVGTAKKVAAYWEFLGFDNTAVPIVSSMLDVVFKNSVDPVGGTPPAPTGNYYTKSESDARYSRATQLTLSSAPTPTTALATISASAGVGSWGYFEGYKYTWPTATRCERIQPEDTW